MDTQFSDDSTLGLTKDRTPAFTPVSEPGATFDCRYYEGTGAPSGVFTACPTPFPFEIGPLADGTYTVESAATVGTSTDPTPAKRVVKIDGTAPAPAITSRRRTPSPRTRRSRSPAPPATRASRPRPAQTPRRSACASGTGPTPPARRCTASATSPGAGRAGDRRASPPPSPRVDTRRSSARTTPRATRAIRRRARFRIDTTAPNPTIASPVAQNPVVDTNQGRPTITGAAGTETGTGIPARDGDAITIAIYAGTTAADKRAEWTATRQEDGHYSSQMPGTIADGAGAALPDGQYNARVTQTDGAGNASTSPARGFKIDTIAPTIALTSPPVTTANRTPPFAGTAGIAEANTSSRSADSLDVTLRVYEGTTATGTPVQAAATVQRAAGGAFSVSPTSNLPDGTYTGEVTQSDNAGNVGRSSRTLKVDNTNPAVSVTAPSRYTNDTTPVISGATGTKTGAEPDAVADEATVDVELYAGTAGSGTPLQAIADVPRASSRASASSRPPR